LGESTSVDPLGQQRIAIATLAVGDDEFVYDAAKLVGEAIDGSRAVILVVWVSDDQKYFWALGMRLLLGWRCHEFEAFVCESQFYLNVTPNQSKSPNPGPNPSRKPLLR
jgi:hypothetical protein